ncbi:MAG: hypothetical protein ACFFD2_16620 [Promethearchaeota archaeon]
MISRKNRKKSAKIQKLKDRINSPHNAVPLLDALHALEHVRIHDKDIFFLLKRISISNRDDGIRYVATKFLYKNFPEESIDFITRLLLNDSNYNFRVINLSKQQRYNFNDIINWGIEKSHNRELMIKNIIRSDLLWFALSWKDYRNEFDILYDINLNCFLLTVKKTNETAYICRRATDPFQDLPILSLQNLLELNHLTVIQSIAGLYRDLLAVKTNELKIAHLSPEKGSGLPDWKVFSYTCELVIYLELNS